MQPRLLISAAPISSYYYMSAEGDKPPDSSSVEIKVETPPAPPAHDGPSAADHAAIKHELESIKERLDAVAEEAREWSKTEIQAALSRLENLEATATEGLKNLASQVTEMQTRLRDLLTRKSQEPPTEGDQTIVETPPQVPPEPPAHNQHEPGEGDTQGAAPAPSALQKQPRPKTKVV
jgi:hypothetical protein